MIRAPYEVKFMSAGATAAVSFLLAVFCGTTLVGQSAPVTSSQNHYDPGRVRQILQEARANQAADSRTRMALEEIGQRQVKTFTDFKKQCLDLQAKLDEADAMEGRKRHLLTELEQLTQSRPDYSEIQRFFETIQQMEDETDKAEPIWRGMIACSRILDSSTQSQKLSYQVTCIDPANKQLDILRPQIAKSMSDLQNQLKRYGEDLPPDLLKLMIQ